jgi:hypothetical protein
MFRTKLWVITLITFLLCLLLLPLIISCSASSSIATVDDIQLWMAGGCPPSSYNGIPFGITVMLKPHNASPNISYTVDLYENNLVVGEKQVSWSQDDLTAQRDGKVDFCLANPSPQVVAIPATASLRSVYHVEILKP